MKPACIFTIVARNYLPYARALAASVKKHAPEVDFLAVLCDTPYHTPPERFPLVTLDQLSLPKADRFAFQYSILELNTAVKPFAFAHLFTERNYERVIYFDPDILIFDSLAPMLDLLDRHAVLLTPHLTRPLDDDRHPSDLNILRSGAYNLGFIAMRRNSETTSLVAWWQRHLQRHCVVDLANGLFTDQRWIDLVPGMFDDVAIVRDAGWNTAYWNLAHRRISESGNVLSCGGSRLLFFHFSGYNANSQSISRHQNRFTLDDLNPVERRLFADYGKALAAARNPEEIDASYGYARLADGTPIPDCARIAYREEHDWSGSHPPLDTLEGGEYIKKWLNAPAPSAPAGTPWISRLALKAYALREDLRHAFPDLAGRDGARYGYWLLENAPTQLQFAEAFLQPIRQRMRDRGWTVPYDARARPSDSRTVRGVERFRRPPSLSRGSAFRLMYRLAESARIVVRPVTSRQFRHRVRDSLLRRGYNVPSTVPSSPPTTPQHGGVAAPVAINVFGYVNAESGVGESARATIRAALAADVPVAVVDFRVGNVSRMTESLPDGVAVGQMHEINLFHVNADQMKVLRRTLGEQVLANHYNIGFWAWEMPDFPDEWLPEMGALDEIWVPSTFCQRSIAQKARVPVVCIPHAIDTGVVVPIDRGRWAVPEDAVVFATMFDALSVPERKNPLAVISAFRTSFPGAGARVRLLVKAGNLAFVPELQRQLQELSANDPRIMLFEDYLARNELRSLMRIADCFVSLHRSEGFGLGLAEAMEAAIPVVATGWSGNTDFMNLTNSLVVKYRLVELERDFGPYKAGQTWAEPDIVHAAEQMRRLYEDPQTRRQVGEAGRATVRAELSPATVGALIRGRLERIQSLRANRTKHE